MLLQRVITALVLLAILLPALFYPDPGPFTLVVLALMAAGAWEWGRLNGFGQAAALGLGALCVGLCGLSWAAGGLQSSMSWAWAAGGAVGTWRRGIVARWRGGVAADSEGLARRWRPAGPVAGVAGRGAGADVGRELLAVGVVPGMGG